MSELLEIFDKNGCDKGTTGQYAHLYHTVYEPAFEPFRNDPINILEVGIWKGTSHQSWVDYFPNAQVYGIDVFTRMKESDVPVLQHERVHHLKADSTSYALPMLVEQAFGKDIQFDFIIDDGLHTPEANAMTFKHLIRFLKPTGRFFIEDVWALDKLTTEESKHPWIQKPEYSILEYNKFIAALEGYAVKRHDLRKISKITNSYIFEVRKV